MSQHTNRRHRSLLPATFAIIAIFLAAACAQAQFTKDHAHELEPQPSAAGSAPLDRQGDALPEKASARLGNSRLRHEGALGVAFSPDAKVLATFNESELRLWDVRDGKEFPWLLESSSVTVKIVKIRFSTDSSTLFTTLSSGRVQQWNLETGKIVGQENVVMQKAGPFDAKTTSADGKLRASIEQDIIRIERVADGQRLQLLPGHDGAVIGIAISRDGKLLASAGADGQVVLWDVPRAEVRRQWRDTKSLCLAISSDGKLLAIGEARDAEGRRGAAKGGIHICDVKTGREIHHLPAHGDAVFALAFSPDGKRLLSAGSDNRARLWDTSDWKELRQFAPRKPRDPERTANPWAVAFSADGTLMAICAADDEEINLWNADPTKEPVRIPRHWPLAFRPDGKTLLAQNHFGQLSLREVATGKELAFSKILGWLPSPDGKMILVRSPGGREIHLRDWALDENLLSFHGQRGKIRAAVFVADGRSLFTATSLGTILQWDVAAPLQQHRLEKLWGMLLAESNTQAARAVNAFVAMPQESMPFLKARVEAFAKEVSIARLVDDLDHGRFVVRHEATRQLERIGRYAVPELKAALEKNRSLEFKRRVEGLLERINAAPAMLPEERAAMRTVTVMERLGTADASEVLRKLAAGYPAAQVTRAAKAALDRLEEKRNK